MIKIGPNHEWLFHDAKNSSVGIDACMARPQEWKDADMTRKDYCECNSDDYNSCEFYKARKEEERNKDE